MIERTPYFDALDPEGLSNLMEGMFGVVETPKTPALLLTPEIAPSPENVLHELANILSSPPGGGMKKRGLERENGGDIAWGDSKRWKFRCDAGKGRMSPCKSVQRCSALH